jgi:hypothetical protein
MANTYLMKGSEGRYLWAKVRYIKSNKECLYLLKTKNTLSVCVEHLFDERYVGRHFWGKA